MTEGRTEAQVRHIGPLESGGPPPRARRARARAASAPMLWSGQPLIGRTRTRLWAFGQPTDSGAVGATSPSLTPVEGGERGDGVNTRTYASIPSRTGARLREHLVAHGDAGLARAGPRKYGRTPARSHCSAWDGLAATDDRSMPGPGRRRLAVTTDDEVDARARRTRTERAPTLWACGSVAFDV